MSFFNPKMDILDVKLNTYGVFLYSRGEFQPVYFIPTDSGMVYEDFELGSEFIEYIRERFAFLRPQRDLSFDTSIQNFNYFFDSVSPCAVGESLETVVGDETRTMVPNINISFGKGEVSSAEKMDNILYINLKDIETKYKKEILPNESIVDGGIFERNGTYYRAQEDYLFLDISEQGAEFTKENFWLLVFEKNESEYKQIDLEEVYLSEYGLQQEVRSIVNDVVVKTDNKIDIDYLCRHVEKENNDNNVYISNKGTINVDLMGKLCSEKLKTARFGKNYINRKEKDLGNEC